MRAIAEKLFSLAALILNYNVITAGMDATTDMSFSALALSVARAGSRRRLAAGLAAFGLAAFVFLLPHLILTMKAFGEPFYNENWKNLAFKRREGATVYRVRKEALRAN